MCCGGEDVEVVVPGIAGVEGWAGGVVRGRGFGLVV